MNPLRLPMPGPACFAALCLVLAAMSSATAAEPGAPKSRKSLLPLRFRDSRRLESLKSIERSSPRVLDMLSPLKLAARSGAGGLEGAGAGGLEGTVCGDCVAGALTCGGSLDGALEESDCSVDDTFVDVWQLELAETTSLTLELASPEFDTLVFLLDASCETIDSNDDCTAGDLALSCLTRTVPAGSYFVVVNSFESSETGAYTLSASCAPPPCESCDVVAVACDGTAGGTLEAGDCPGVGGRFLDLYSFELATSGPIDIELDSGIDTVLTLYNADCEPIAENDDCSSDNLNSCLRDLDLAAGTYFAGVTTYDPGVSGDVTVALSCPDVSFCRADTAGTLTCSESVEGSLSSDDRELDDGSRVDIWTIEIDETSDVTIDLGSGVFDTFLFVLDRHCEVVATNDDCPDGGTDSCLTTILPPGRYSIAANSFEGGVEGAYSLGVECTPSTACSQCLVGEIACGGSTSGELDAGDCFFADETFFDVYAMTVDRGQRVTIDLTSEEIDPYLLLLDANCESIIENDDCDPDNFVSDSCIVIDLPAGEYFVVANSFDAASGVGRYDLRVDCAEIPLCRDCNVGTIGCNESVDASFPASGCQLSDETGIDVWQLDLPADGTVDITLSATGFDTYLFLLDESCVPIGENDDCEAGDTTSSCLSLPLTAGRHFIAVNAFSPGSGDYTLEVSAPECIDCQSCRAGAISCGETVSQLLGESSCTSSDGAPLDTFELTLGEPTTVSISLASPEFDPLLSIVDASCGAIAENDDCDDGTTGSCLERTLAAGTYLVGVSSRSPDAFGAFILTITRCEAGASPTRVPGDCTGDGNLNITDGICLLNYLFLAGESGALPCGDGSDDDPGNIALMDVNDDRGLNISDAVSILAYLFGGGPEPTRGLECAPIDGCSPACKG